MSGNIHDAAVQFLHPRERKTLRSYLAAGFDVTWANTRSHAGTTIRLFPEPSDALADAYGFDYESPQSRCRVAGVQTSLTGRRLC
jgi:hypothetical protein